MHLKYFLTHFGRKDNSLRNCAMGALFSQTLYSLFEDGCSTMLSRWQMTLKDYFQSESIIADVSLLFILLTINRQGTPFSIFYSYVLHLAAYILFTLHKIKARCTINIPLHQLVKWCNPSSKQESYMKAETESAFKSKPLSRAVITALGDASAGIPREAFSVCKPQPVEGSSWRLIRETEPAMRPSYVRPDGSIA